MNPNVSCWIWIIIGFCYIYIKLKTYILHITIIFSWLLFSFIFAFIGASRQIGFFLSLIACLLFSPLIGLIIILSSTKNSTKIALNQQGQIIKDQQTLVEYNSYVKVRAENPEIYTVPELFSNEQHVKLESSIIPNDAIGKPIVFKKYEFKDGQKIKAGKKVIHLAYGKKSFTISEGKAVKVRHVLKRGEFVLEGDVLYIIEEI